jgi:hypothetical protein
VDGAGVAVGPPGRCERSWSLCAPSAAKLESVGVVLTVITVMTAIVVWCQGLRVSPIPCGPLCGGEGCSLSLRLFRKASGKFGHVDDRPFVCTFADQLLFSSRRYVELDTPILYRRDLRSEYDNRSDQSRQTVRSGDVQRREALIPFLPPTEAQSECQRCQMVSKG